MNSSTGYHEILVSNETKYKKAYEYIRTLPDHTVKINISNMRLTELPDLSRFTQLEELNCNRNNLSVLPPLPNTLKILDCSENSLYKLPTLPDALMCLNCQLNLLTSLPDLPNTLDMLDCSENLLVRLPTLPNDKLNYLKCDFNSLTSLPELPKSLKILICSDNYLTTLPRLPDHLSMLYCDQNELTRLPKIPNRLSILHCADNQLTCLPNLPFCVMTVIYCRDNPLLPFLSNIKTFGGGFVDIRARMKNLDLDSFISVTNKFNRFKHLFYCIKFKTQFRKWLWEKVREPKCMDKYHPQYLLTHLQDENQELDMVLHSW